MTIIPTGPLTTGMTLMTMALIIILTCIRSAVRIIAFKSLILVQVLTLTDGVTVCQVILLVRPKFGHTGQGTDVQWRGQGVPSLTQVNRGRDTMILMQSDRPCTSS